jgi:site-specific recombinase XerD
MSKKQTKTTTSGLDWNSMHGLLVRLKRDGKHREYLLIATGCYFGLRITDLLSLKFSDVLNKDEFYLIEHKTGKERKITINTFVKETITFIAEEKTRAGTFDINDYLFKNRVGNNLTIQFINVMLHTTFKDYNVKVQNGSSHTLRKTFGKRVWEMDNKSERALVYLSEIFSHSSISTTKRYIGITEKQIADVYMQL